MDFKKIIASGLLIAFSFIVFSQNKFESGVHPEFKKEQQDKKKSDRKEQQKKEQKMAAGAVVSVVVLGVIGAVAIKLILGNLNKSLNEGLENAFERN